MSLFKKIVLGLLVILIAIQFIQPVHNNKGQVGKGDIIKHLNVPQNVQAILKRACYDCHSNNTAYPWYSNIQPAGWLLASHIKEGKAELNFDDFAAYSGRRQLSKLRSIAGSVKDGSMPLSAYTFLHPKAKLTPEEKAVIIDWAAKAKDSLSVAR